MADPLTCPFCGAVSHNPSDVAQRYCVRCHVFVDDAIETAERIDEAGWARFIRERKAPERWAFAFGQLGLVSSISTGPGQRDYRLTLNLFGRAVRKALIEMEPEDG
jgi:hypothetical protein